VEEFTEADCLGIAAIRPEIRTQPLQVVTAIAWLRKPSANRKRRSGAVSA
jgi:hypothetical protein